jgi:hypothetical protein
MTSTHSTSYAELNAILDQARRAPANSVPVTDAQLLALQRRWTTALAARLDQAIESAAAGDDVALVTRTWHTLAAHFDTLRAVLDAYEPHSAALADALRTEYRILALGAGLASPAMPTEQAVRAGRALRERIRPTAAEPARELAHA